MLDIDLDGSPVVPAADRLAEAGVPFLVATGWVLDRVKAGYAAPVLQKPFDPHEPAAAIAALTRARAGDRHSRA
ncbi:hypothetical protein E2C06_34155 [Dankookia rubra]|uniref:Response regulator n=1 Tax=Dankookia rubra TaxID=1442381 RepID=A0A4R5Q6S1_9PROT|nr:hypothetical protein [Dankookia rubra]TDH58138.1 hypothetical protein E2C06_34155 [Dankookia rubra]